MTTGAGDAVVERELDTVAKDFVKDGSSLPKAKSQVAWRDGDTLRVGTGFGEGSLTDPGDPRLVKLWKRGTPRGAPVRLPLEDAALSRDRPSASPLAAAQRRGRFENRRGEARVARDDVQGRAARETDLLIQSGADPGQPALRGDE